MAWIMGFSLLVFAGLFWWALMLQYKLEVIEDRLAWAIDMIENCEKEESRLDNQVIKDVDELHEKIGQLRIDFEEHVRMMWAHVPDDVRKEFTT